MGAFAFATVKRTSHLNLAHGYFPVLRAGIDYLSNAAILLLTIQLQ